MSDMTNEELRLRRVVKATGQNADWWAARAGELEAALVAEGHGLAGGLHNGDHMLAGQCGGCAVLGYPQQDR